MSVSTPAKADDSDTPERLDQSNFLTLGIGQGHTTGVGEERASRGLVMAIHLGQSIVQGVHFIEEIRAFFGEASPGKTITSETHGQGTVGVRWVPFEARRIPTARRWLGSRYMDFSFVSIRATAGLDVKAVTTYGQTERSERLSYGPTAALTLAWLPHQGTEHAWGIELSGQLSLFDGGVQRGLGVALVAQLGR